MMILRTHDHPKKNVIRLIMIPMTPHVPPTLDPSPEKTLPKWHLAIHVGRLFSTALSQGLLVRDINGLSLWSVHPIEMEEDKVYDIDSDAGI